MHMTGGMALSGIRGYPQQGMDPPMLLAYMQQQTECAQQREEIHRLKLAAEMDRHRQTAEADRQRQAAEVDRQRLVEMATRPRAYAPTGTSFPFQFPGTNQYMY